MYHISRRPCYLSLQVLLTNDQFSCLPSIVKSFVRATQADTETDTL